MDGRGKAAHGVARVLSWDAHSSNGTVMKSPAKSSRAVWTPPKSAPTKSSKAKVSKAKVSEAKAPKADSSNAKSWQPKPPQEKSSQVYQLKITLLGSKPSIWRRLLVPGTMSLETLSYVLLAVMGWGGGHMHQFHAPDGTRYGEPNSELELVDEARARLDRVLPRAKSAMIFEYDFGDSWEHKVAVEKILGPSDDLVVPSCIDGKRACPPDDCGGIWGYVDFLEAIGDPEHDQHDEMMEWGGEDFDPEHFDPKEVNARFAPRRR